MKTFSLLIIPLWVFASAGSGQSLSGAMEPLLSKNKVWHSVSRFSHCSSSKCITTKTYRIGPDSVINNHQYQAVELIYGYYQSSDTVLYGFVRETDDGKVYLLRNNRETLYYDFGAGISDTIGDWHVVAIETELDGRRIFTLQCNCTSSEKKWIEGIGSMGGLFYENSVFCGDGVVGRSAGGKHETLICVYDQGVTIYQDEDFKDWKRLCRKRGIISRR